MASPQPSPPPSRYSCPAFYSPTIERRSLPNLTAQAWQQNPTYIDLQIQALKNSILENLHAFLALDRQYKNLLSNNPVRYYQALKARSYAYALNTGYETWKGRKRVFLDTIVQDLTQEVYRENHALKVLFENLNFAIKTVIGEEEPYLVFMRNIASLDIGRFFKSYLEEETLKRIIDYVILNEPLILKR